MKVSRLVLFWYQHRSSGMMSALVSKHFKQYAALLQRYLLYSLSVLFVLSDFTCAGNFSSSLHMVYVIFAHSHLYFKKPTPSDSLLLPGTFSCPHSCQHLLQSARQPVSWKKKKQQEENKWDCYISWTLKHFRSSGCLPHCTALLSGTVQWAGAAGSQEARVFIVVWVSGWGSAGESQVTVHEWWMCWKLLPLHEKFISPLIL